MVEAYAYRSLDCHLRNGGVPFHYGIHQYGYHIPSSANNMDDKRCHCMDCKKEKTKTRKNITMLEYLPYHLHSYGLALDGIMPMM